MTAVQTISFLIPVYWNDRAVSLTYAKIKSPPPNDPGHFFAAPRTPPVSGDDAPYKEIEGFLC